MKNLVNKKSENGFTVLEIILLLLVCVLIVFLGIGFYNYTQNNSTSENEKNAQQSTKENNNEPDGAEEVSFSTSDKKVLIDDFYAKYLVIEQSSAAPLIELAKEYGTSNFVSYVSEDSGGDPVLCGQQGKSQAEVSTAIEGQDIVATISYPSNNNPKVKFTTVVEAEKLLIDSATCL